MNDLKKSLGLNYILLILSVVILFVGFLVGKIILVASVIGAVVLASLAILNMRDAKEKRRKFLKANGRKITCSVKYISVEVSENAAALGGGGAITNWTIFKIVCEPHNKSENLIEYVSDPLSLMPDIRINSGMILDVYINPQDPKDYWVDISKIPVKISVGFSKPIGKNTVYYRSYDGINYQRID